jgi:hypothetical protein
MIRKEKQPESAATTRGIEGTVAGQYPELPDEELPENLKPRHLQDPNAELEELLRAPLKKP